MRPECIEGTEWVADCGDCQEGRTAGPEPGAG